MKDYAEEILKSVFDRDIKKEDLCRINIKSFEKWDSLSHVKVIILIEELLDLRLETEELLSIDSYQNINKIIKRNMKNK